MTREYEETDGREYKKIIIVVILIAVSILVLIFYLNKRFDKNFPKENVDEVNNYYQSIISETKYNEEINELWENMNKDTLEGLPDIVEYINSNLYSNYKLNFGDEIYEVFIIEEDDGVNLYLKSNLHDRLQLINNVKIDSETEENPFEYHYITVLPVVELVSKDIQLNESGDSYNIVSYKGDKVVTYKEKGDPYVHEYRLNPKDGMMNIKRFK